MEATGISLNLKLDHLNLEDLPINISKIETKDEFCDMLKSAINEHIALTIHEPNYESDKMVLGIDPDYNRPFIDTEKELTGCDIYNLKEYLNSYSINYEDKYWELIDDTILIKLAKKYIPIDIYTESKKSQLESMKPIDPKEFKKRFHDIMFKYLFETNRIATAEFFPNEWDQCLRRLNKRYFGVDRLTLTPCVGIIESMDGCDIYDIEKISSGFRKGDNGLFVESPIGFAKFYLDDRSILNALVNKYFSNKSTDDDKLPLFSVIDETTDKYSGECVAVYSRDFNAYSNRAIVGKYYYYDKTVNTHLFIPKSLNEYLQWYKSLYKEMGNKIRKGYNMIEKARQYKHDKKYDKAVELYHKCLDLDVGFELFHDLLVCYRKLKDLENEIKTAKAAYDFFPDNQEYKKAYLKVVGGLGKSELCDKPYVCDEAYDYGEAYFQEILKLQEFTFSIKDHPFSELFFTELSEGARRAEDHRYQQYLRGVREIQGYFSTSIKEAKNLEGLGELEEATKIYERLIAEKCYRVTPYERLTVIYSKLKRKGDLIRVLKYSINHFETLEKKQYEYVTELADKYNAHEVLNQILNEKGVVKYWFGDIVLYQKYPIVEKFQEKLQKVLTSPK